MIWSPVLIAVDKSTRGVLNIHVHVHVHVLYMYIQKNVAACLGFKICDVECERGSPANCKNTR